MIEATKALLSLIVLGFVSLIVFYNIAQSTIRSSTIEKNQDLAAFYAANAQLRANLSDASSDDYIWSDNSDDDNVVSNQEPKKVVHVNLRSSKKASDKLFEKESEKPFTRATNPFYLLGAYPTITTKHQLILYDLGNYGIHNDDDYCEIVDSYNLAHQENMFEYKNFMSDYGVKSDEMFRSKYMPEFLNDTMPEIQNTMLRKSYSNLRFHFKKEITTFFTKRADFHSFHQIGTNFLCATQMYNHIPGHDAIWRKDYIVDSVNDYLATFKDRPQCFAESEDMFFPFAYRLYNEDECLAFFKIINSEAYNTSLATEPMQYLIKIGSGSHRARGVFLLEDNKTAELNTQYELGKKCGTINNTLIAQKYVANPLLLDLNNKFDFRIYMLVASTNPLMVYYHDGFLRVSVTPYDKFSTEKGVHLTNTFVNKEKFKEAKEQNKTIYGMNEQQLRDYHIWEFERLQSYLLESGKVKDPQWLDNYLRPAFKKAFIHVVRMGKQAFWNQSNVYEFFGLDFMLDDQLNLWFIECNASPQFVETNERSLAFLNTMLTDMFEITYNLYKSRMTRILKLLKDFDKEKEANKDIDYNKWKDLYSEASKNRLEPEFKISEDSSFTLIMDENKSGTDAYFGLISSDCV